MQNVLLKVAGLADAEMCDFFERLLQNGYPDFVDGLRRLLEDKPRLDDVRRISTALLRINAVELAEKTSRWTISHPDPSHDDILFHAVVLTQFKSTTEEGREMTVLRQCLELLSQGGPHRLVASMALGFFWLDHLGQPSLSGEQGRTAFSRALETEPDLVEAWVGLGMCLKTLGDDSGALDCMEKALAASGGRFEVARLWRAFWADPNSDCSAQPSENAQPRGLALDLKDDKTVFADILDDQGFVVLRGAVSPDERQRIMEIIERDIWPETVTKGGGQEQAISQKIGIDYGPQAARSELHKLLLGCPFVSHVADYLKKAHPLWRISPHSGWNFQYQQPSEILNSGIHQDRREIGNRTNMATCWIALTDAGGDVAPGLEVWSKRFEMPIIAPLASSVPGLNMPDAFIRNYLKPVRFAPAFEAGDVLVFKPDVFHSTLQCGSRVRRSLDVRFESGPAFWSPFQGV